MPTTDLEIRLLGLHALNKELGHIGAFVLCSNLVTAMAIM
jgi:hypothetical protein